MWVLGASLPRAASGSAERTSTRSPPEGKGCRADRQISREARLKPRCVRSFSSEAEPARVVASTFVSGAKSEGALFPTPQRPQPAALRALGGFARRRARALGGARYAGGRARSGRQTGDSGG